MKTMRTPLLAGALLLALGSTAALAGSPKPFEVDFDKCFIPDVEAPYLFTFAGPVSGDRHISGNLKAKVLVFDVDIEPTWTNIQADYVVTGTLPFTARVGGRTNGRAVLRGYVSEGPPWLKGAGVHDEFFAYNRADGTPCAKGTLYITPRWKQSHNDDDND
jgi:hypothetical protein